MINEIAQWGVLVSLAVLVLGVLRQVGLLLPPQARAVPSGPTPGRRAPRRLLDALRETIPAAEGLGKGAVVAFVNENCSGCQRLIADLAEGRQTPNGQPLVLVSDRASDQFQAALKQTGILTVDPDEELWRACGITATPLLVRLDENGRVAAKEVTHRVEAVSAAVE